MADWAVGTIGGNRQLAMSNWQDSIGNRKQAIGNEQLAKKEFNSTFFSLRQCFFKYFHYQYTHLPIAHCQLPICLNFLAFLS